jgi:hypothetical protein
MTLSLAARLARVEARHVSRVPKVDAARLAALHAQVADILGRTEAGRQRQELERVRFESLSTEVKVCEVERALAQARTRFEEELVREKAVPAPGGFNLADPALAWLVLRGREIELLKLRGCASHAKIEGMSRRATALVRSGRWRSVLALDAETDFEIEPATAEAARERVLTTMTRASSERPDLPGQDVAVSFECNSFL